MLKAETEITTRIALQKWLVANCYRMNNYSINGNTIYEGYGLEHSDGIFKWFYTEGGAKRTLEYFKTEKEAVAYALRKIKADGHANRNYIGMYADHQEVEQLLSELKKRKVEFWTDKIPFGGMNDLRTRVFVIGCGIKNVQDLIKKE